MLGSVIGLQAALQHSPYAFVVYRLVEPFFRKGHPEQREGSSYFLQKFCIDYLHNDRIQYLL